MKASEIFAAVNLLVDARQPTFVWGQPGIGKSDLMAQVAETRKIPLQDVRALLLDPVDLRGLPYFRPLPKTRHLQTVLATSRQSGHLRTFCPGTVKEFSFWTS